MPQEFHVLRCCSCDVFQVHQVKKANKWSCKMCGQKQSVKKVYGQGSGADCRRHVQKLNMLKGEQQETSLVAHMQQEDQQEEEPPQGKEEMTGVPPVIPSGPSRWHQYVEADEDDDGDVPEHGETFTTDRRAFETVRKGKRYANKSTEGYGYKPKQRFETHFEENQDFTHGSWDHRDSINDGSSFSNSVDSRDSNRSDAWTTKRSRISGPTHPQEGIYPELLPVQSGSSHDTIFPKSLVNKSELGAKTAPKYSSMTKSGLNHANLSNSKWGQYVGDVPLSIDTYGPTTGAHNGKTFSAHETEYQREASFGHSEKKSTSLYPEENHEFTRDSIVFSNVAQKLSQPLPMQTNSKSMPGTVVPSSKWAKFIEPQTKTYESESEDDDSENIPEVSTENDPHREYQDIICDRDSDKRISTNEAGVFFQVDDDLDEVLQDDF